MVEAKNRKGGDMLQQLTKQNTHLIFILGYTQNITAKWAKEPFLRNSSVSNKKFPVTEKPAGFRVATKRWQKMPLNFI